MFSPANLPVSKPCSEGNEEAWCLDSEVGSRKLEVGSWKSEVGSWKLEVGSRKSEDGSWKSEVGSQKLEVGRPISAFVEGRLLAKHFNNF